MTLDETTKEIWDETFKESIIIHGAAVIESMKKYQELIKLRNQYRKDYSTNRIIHQIDFDNGILTYKKGPKRNIGYQLSYKKGNNDDKV